MRRHFTLIALALAVSGSGCASPDGPPAPTAEVATLLAVLPAQAPMVFGLDLARLRQTAAWQAHATALRALAPQIAAVQAACGLDLADRIDRIVASAGGDGADRDGAIAVIKGRFDEAKVASCATALIRRLGDQAAITSDGKLTTYSARKRDEALLLLWTAPDTVALAPGAIGDGAPLRRLLGDPAPPAPALAALLAEVDTRSILWGAGALPALARDQMKGMGYVPDGFFFAVDLPGDVELRFSLRYPDEQAAMSSAKLFKVAVEQIKEKPPLPQLAGMLARAKISYAGRTVRLAATLTLEQVAALRAMASDFAATLN